MRVCKSSPPVVEDWFGCWFSEEWPLVQSEQDRWNTLYWFLHSRLFLSRPRLLRGHCLLPIALCRDLVLGLSFSHQYKHWLSLLYFLVPLLFLGIPGDDCFLLPSPLYSLSDVLHVKHVSPSVFAVDAHSSVWNGSAGLLLLTLRYSPKETESDTFVLTICTEFLLDNQHHKLRFYFLYFS